MSIFKIRKITDSYRPSNQNAIEQVFSILRLHFPSVSEEKINEILEQMKDPLKYAFSSSLFVAEDGRSTVKGFAILFYMPDKNFCYLDYLAVVPDRISSGIGGALYERMREEAQMLKSIGLFMECLPDDEKLCRDTAQAKQNRDRLAFYERYGARPVWGTKYETLVDPEDDCPPYLVFDDLGNDIRLSARQAKKIVKAILERKYPDYCPKEYLVYLKKAIKKISGFHPDYLIVSLGFDPAKGDPTGTWSLRAADFRNNGAELGRLPYPILFIQEGGYKNRTLGINARNFFDGYLSARVINKR